MTTQNTNRITHNKLTSRSSVECSGKKTGADLSLNALSLAMLKVKSQNLIAVIIKIEVKNYILKNKEEEIEPSDRAVMKSIAIILSDDKIKFNNKHLFQIKQKGNLKMKNLLLKAVFMMFSLFFAFSITYGQKSIAELKSYAQSFLRSNLQTHPEGSAKVFNSDDSKLYLKSYLKGDSASAVKSNASLTQPNRKFTKTYIALSIGAAFPHGDFADYSPGNADNGFANLGIMYDLSFTYFMSPRFGLAALIRGQNNSIDLDDYLNELAGGGTEADWNITSDSWRVTSFMFGMEIAFTNNERGGTYTRLMGGIATATYPEFMITVSNGSSSEFVKQSSASGSGFAFLWAYGFWYNLSENVSMLGNIDLLGGFPDFKKVPVTSSVTSNVLYDNLSTNIWTMNLSLGVGYTF